MERGIEVANGKKRGGGGRGKGERGVERRERRDNRKRKDGTERR